MNFKDKSRWETIRQYINRKQAENYEKRKNNVAFLGVLILLVGLFISLAR